jgi:hypothetical protein
VPIIGDQHYVLVRAQGSRRSYAFGLAPNQRVALSKNDRGYRQVAEASFVWEHGRRYRLQVDVRDAEIIASVDGHTVLRWIDSTNPYLFGQLGIATVAGHTRIERIKFCGKEA